MKKLVMFILCLTLLLPLGVYAEEYVEPTPDIDSVEPGNNEASTTITVGNVATPVYEVFIYWDNPSFDWVYNRKDNTYGWKPTPICESYRYDPAEITEKNIILYTDDSCTIEAGTIDYDNLDSYYFIRERDGYHISIDDTSKDGEIIPKIKWESAEKYSYVNANFQYLTFTDKVCNIIEYKTLFESALELGQLYSDSSCNNEVKETNVEYQENTYYTIYKKWFYKSFKPDTELPREARIPGAGSAWGPADFLPTYYSINMNLVTNGTQTEKPTAGDTIGTITISISAAE